MILRILSQTSTVQLLKMGNEYVISFILPGYMLNYRYMVKVNPCSMIFFTVDGMHFTWLLVSNQRLCFGLKYFYRFLSLLCILQTIFSRYHVYIKYEYVYWYTLTARLHKILFPIQISGRTCLQCIEEGCSQTTQDGVKEMSCHYVKTSRK